MKFLYDVTRFKHRNISLINEPDFVEILEVNKSPVDDELVLIAKEFNGNQRCPIYTRHHKPRLICIQ